MAYPAYPSAQPGTVPGFSSDGQVPGVHLGMSAPAAGSSGPAVSAGAAPYWGLPAGGGVQAQAPGGESAEHHLAAEDQNGAAVQQGAQEGASVQANGGLDAAEAEANLFLGSPDRLEGAADQSVDIAGLNDMLTFPQPSLHANGTSFYDDHEAEYKQQHSDGGALGQGHHEGSDEQNHHESSFPPMSHAGQGDGAHGQGGHSQGNHVGDFSSLDGGHPGEALLLMDDHEGEHHWLS